MSFFVKIFVFGSLGFSLLGCVHLPFSTEGVKPKTVYKIEQAILISPDKPDWALMQNEIHSLILAKKFNDRSQSAVIVALMYPASVHKTSRTFLEYVMSERSKNDDKNRFRNLSAKNEFVTFKNLPCLKYETLAEDHKDKGITSSDFEYFKTEGYICRYPLEYIVFQIEVSHRSQQKQMPLEISKIGQEFFQNIELVDGTIKRLKLIP